MATPLNVGTGSNLQHYGQMLAPQMIITYIPENNLQNTIVNVQKERFDPDTSSDQINQIKTNTAILHS